MTKKNSENGKEVVIVRDWMGRQLVRAVLSADDRAVLVCSLESLPEIEAGRREPPLLGFPREDVFVAGSAVLAAIQKDGAVSWDQLVRY